MSTKFVVIGLIAIVVLIVLWVIRTYNKLIKHRYLVEEGFSTIDVYLKKRFDLVPNLVETVKGYAKHESSTLEKVTAARSAISSATTTEERLAQENQLTSCLKTLFAVSEAYPDLKANSNFLDLQQQLQNIEAELTSARKYYNGTVRKYNTLLAVFPKNIVASIFGFKSKPLFEVDSPEERKAVKVSF